MKTMNKWILCGLMASGMTAGTSLADGPAVAKPAEAAEVKAAGEVTAEAKAVVEKFVEATGGRAAYDSIKSRKMVATMSLKETGLSGTITSYAKPGLALMESDLQGVGKTRVGLVDGIVWSSDPLLGPRIVEGKEAATMIASLKLDEGTNLDRFASAKVIGSENLNGVDMLKLELISKEGTKETRFYEKDSGLLSQIAMTVESPMGKIAITTQVSEYKDAGPVKVPMKMKQTMQGMSPETVVTSLEHNVEIDDTVFALPEEIKKLIEKKKAAPAPAAAPAAGN
jgi:hypothetical protein